MVGAATRWPVGAVWAGLAGWGVPGLLAGNQGRNEAVGRIEAIAGWAEILRDTMAGAAGLEQAIVATAPVAPLPIRAEVVILAVRLEGERLGAAGRGLDRLRPDGDRRGSLAQAARDQATMRLRVEAGRARTRTSIKVIVGATGGLALGLAVLNRGYLAPYDSALGQFVLLVVGGLFAASFVWLAKMSRPTTTERFLTTAEATSRDGLAEVWS